MSLEAAISNQDEMSEMPREIVQDLLRSLVERVFDDGKRRIKGITSHYRYIKHPV